MIGFNVSPAVRKIYDQYKDLFLECGMSYNISCSLLVLFIYGKSTLSSLVRSCPWTHSVSALSRAIPNFKPNRFLRRLQSKVLKKYRGLIDSNNFCYAIDDTANPKFGNRMHASHPFYSSSGPYFGQKILVIALVDIKSGIAIPLTYSFLTSTKNKGHLKAQDVAINLMQGLINFNFPVLPVVTDSWFDSVEFIRNLKKMGFEFAGELKGNRVIKGNPGPNVKWKKITQIFNGLVRQRLPVKSSKNRKKAKQGKVYAELFGYIKNLGQSLKIIAVYNRKNGVSAFAYYATTDLKMSGAKLWKLSRARWCIECLFRDLKQNLSFGQLSCRGEGGANLAVCLPLILYASIRLNGTSVWEAKKNDTVGLILKKEREVDLSKSIEWMLYNQKNSKILKLKSRRVNLCTKPTDGCGNLKSA